MRSWYIKMQFINLFLWAILYCIFLLTFVAPAKSILFICVLHWFIMEAFLIFMMFKSWILKRWKKLINN